MADLAREYGVPRSAQSSRAKAPPWSWITSNHHVEPSRLEDKAKDAYRFRAVGRKPCLTRTR